MILYNEATWGKLPLQLTVGEEENTALERRNSQFRNRIPESKILSEILQHYIMIFLSPLLPSTYGRRNINSDYHLGLLACPRTLPCSSLVCSSSFKLWTC